MEISFKNGKQNGLVKIYDEDGNIQANGSYKEGVFHGLFRGYYKNGKLKKEENFIEGKKMGYVNISMNVEILELSVTIKMEKKMVYIRNIMKMGN